MDKIMIEETKYFSKANEISFKINLAITIYKQHDIDLFP